MAHHHHQDIEGWPLGLRPLNERLGGLTRNLDFSAGTSISFNTNLLTASPTTTSSSDLDTQSTGSFFHDKSKTLGSLIGVSNISTRASVVSRDRKMSLKPKPWLFWLCSKLTTDGDTTNTHTNYTPSLGHLLDVERRAVSCARSTRPNQSPLRYVPNDYSPLNASNSLFVNGLVAPNQSLSVATKSNTQLLEDGNVFGVIYKKQLFGSWF